MSKFRIYTEQWDYGRATKLAILVEEPSGIVSVAAPLVFTAVDPHEVGQYTFDTPLRTERVDGRGDSHVTRLDGRSLLQAMLDHAWEIGMRPTGQAEADTTKQVAALTYHLEDMRKLVFTAERS